MNAQHLVFCSSPEWARVVEEEMLPWVLGHHDLGDDMLEVGSGPGLTTDVLRKRVPRLTAVELDEALATRLATRLAGTNVEVVQADATAMPFEAGRFSAAGSFTMLHHLPSVALQDRMLAELCRVLKPGGIFLGSDGIDTPSRRAAHEDDIFVPIDPVSFEARLTAAGFATVVVETVNDRFRFFATKPR
ncbi:MAG TPA: class I SAM-dependent methyltransferase [Tepidiformaceae bacterium]|nr:class I SAM-dependent methyltransferase [Tepidiformaceae bacterium]